MIKRVFADRLLTERRGAVSMSRLRAFWMVGVLVVAGLAPAQGQEPRELSVHGDWAAYVMTQNGHRVCYMVAEPTTAAGKYSKRGDIFALITPPTRSGYSRCVQL